MKRPAILLLATTLFNRQWWWTTLLVIVAVGVMTRLGFWQLNRLAQRRVYNAAIGQALAAETLSLTGNEMVGDVTTFQYRAVVVRGVYDSHREMVLKNQTWQGKPGVHLITPLRIEGSKRAVLIDRGWIPYQMSTLQERVSFVEPGVVIVRGRIRLPRTGPRLVLGLHSSPLPAASWQTDWFRMDITAMQAQIPYDLFPFYVQQSLTTDGTPPGVNMATTQNQFLADLLPVPQASAAGEGAPLPYRSEPEVNLSDGPHLGYAVQWYAFALILGIGYLRYVRKSVAENENEEAL